MIDRVLADLVLVVHLIFIIFVVIGGLFALRWRWAPLVHLPAAAWGAYVEISGRICPLTPLEVALRRASGSPGYSSDFIAHYLIPVIYPPTLTRPIQFALAAFVILVNAVIYWFVWHRRRTTN